jgi:hypothetical protein
MLKPNGIENETIAKTMLEIMATRRPKISISIAPNIPQKSEKVALEKLIIIDKIKTITKPPTINKPEYLLIRETNSFLYIPSAIGQINKDKTTIIGFNQKIPLNSPVFTRAIEKT